MKSAVADSTKAQPHSPSVGTRVGFVPYRPGFQPRAPKAVTVFSLSMGVLPRIWRAGARSAGLEAVIPDVWALPYRITLRSRSFEASKAASATPSRPEGTRPLPRYQNVSVS